MFKVKVIAIVLLLLVGISVQANAGNIGFVDLEFLFNSHPEYETKNEELQQLADEISANFQEESAALEDEEEIAQLAQSYEELLEQKAEQLRVTIIVSVREFIGNVADENDISAVVPHNSIIYGGVDLTSKVIEEMYSSYGISVPSNLRR